MDPHGPLPPYMSNEMEFASDNDDDTASVESGWVTFMLFQSKLQPA